MKMKQFVFYGRIEMKLTSALHVGGDSDEGRLLAMDGNGEYIIPASGIAGAVRSYLETGFENKPEEVTKINSFFGSASTGSEDGWKSRVYIYDAVLKTNRENEIESRTGIQIDEVTGTARNGMLHTEYYIAKGATAEIRMQCFCDTKNEFVAYFEKIVKGIQLGELAFGAKKTTGAGRFSAVGYYKVLNLNDDLKEYLKGPQAVFLTVRDHRITATSEDVPGGSDIYTLRAYIPDGLLVGGGSATDKADKVNMNHGNEGDFYIPGSTIKGIVKSYSKKAAKYLDLDMNEVERIFGTTIIGDPQNIKEEHTISYVSADDCDLSKTKKVIYNRVAIDRLLGGALTSRKFTEQVLSTDQNTTIDVTVRVNHSGMSETMRRKANALVFLAMRDLGAGYIAVGSGNSVGHGRLKGKTLIVNGKQFDYSWDDGIASIRVDDDYIVGNLTALKGARNE